VGLLYTKLGATITPHSTLESVGAGFSAGGVLVDSNGAPMQTMDFMGGILAGPYLVPLNVLLFDTWNPGQKEALEPYWTSGEIPRPPAPIETLPVADPNALSLLPLFAGAAVAFFLLRRKG